MTGTFDANGFAVLPMMLPLLLHASSKATGARRRRVRHLLFGPRRPPLGLAWAHAPAC